MVRRKYPIEITNKPIPVYQYNGFIIKVDEIKILRKDMDEFILFDTKRETIAIEYMEKKERDDNFELLASLIK